jgi:hypothetical protein
MNLLSVTSCLSYFVNLLKDFVAVKTHKQKDDLRFRCDLLPVMCDVYGRIIFYLTANPKGLIYLPTKNCFICLFF